MSSIETYDAVMLGSGEGGKYMAWHQAQAGRRVLVIEQRYVGGSCPNIACLPSKNIIHSAAVADIVRNAARFGTEAGGASVSMQQVQARKREMVDGLIAMHHKKFAASGAQLLMGRGRFTGERTIEVALPDGGTRIVRGEQVFLDLGAFATVPALPGLADAQPMTHVELLDRDTLPEHLLVLGGGYIALELAQAMRRLGSRVAVYERAPRLLPREDPDIGDAVRALLEDEGIEINTGAEVSRVSGRSGERVALHALVGGEERVAEGTDLLVALGKAPNTREIGLKEAGVALTQAGYIQVNERLETTAPNVWAMGDCAGTPAFTHMSFEDFRLIRDNLAGGSRSTVGRQVPNCLFIEPELARVGLNEIEAKAQDIPYRLAELPVTAILRTRTTGEGRGKLKVLVGDDDRILGFTAFAPRAGELLPPVQMAMAAGLSYRAVEQLTIAHPTYAEGLVSLFGAVPAAAAVPVAA
jgi:pyruvate/2-oxoglutarate dehydrogenase complex dihydrolipoamide dehydrogenase (E3) component